MLQVYKVCDLVDKGAERDTTCSVRVISKCFFFMNKGEGDAKPKSEKYPQRHNILGLCDKDVTMRKIMICFKIAKSPAQHSINSSQRWVWVWVWALCHGVCLCVPACLTVCYIFPSSCSTKSFLDTSMFSLLWVWGALIWFLLWPGLDVLCSDWERIGPEAGGGNWQK